ncbi:DEAD/DEAH box helicase family protein [Rhodopseudomonas sp.]|uniref:DEAD/DEAH box helicase family protein n=1 Tax=Rhodopseudomonas sp. TaxID=1078 RepID=UPI003B3BC4EE
MIDFNKLKKPAPKTRSSDPREIFKRRPSGEGVANDLWRGQDEALEKWFHDQKDQTLILLNTGAGKTIIGLLIAQSLVNQGVENVIYVCSTIDLIKQTAAEAAKLGLSVTCRMSGQFDNDLFSQGKSFCITTYPALFFGFRNIKPGALIFDDAHVAGKSIRDVFTLSISKQTQPKLYGDVLEFLRPIFSDYHQKMEFDAATRNNDESGSVLLTPPVSILTSAESLSAILDSQITEKDKSLFFPWPFLRDHLKFCAVLVGRGTIEITPPFLPTLSLPAFSKDVKRVYLSATINSKADFTRAFGNKPTKIIAPDVDAGDGERLFLFASKFEKGRVSKELVRRLARETKVLIGVPSHHRGKNWEFATQPTTTDDFSTELDKFRKSKAGAFVLAGRFDGIDLPGSQCRCMVIDGLPSGSSLIEQYLFDRLYMDQVRSTLLSVRITQLLGRIIRGRQDYGLFIIADRLLENWLKNERNRTQLPELLRKQLFLSEGIEEQLDKYHDATSVIETMNKLIERKKDWLDFYRDNINDIDVPSTRLKQGEETATVLEKAGRSEVRFMTMLWDNNPEGAIRELEEQIREVSLVDPKLAGWYSVWIGIAYFAEGKTDAAYDLFEEAHHRIGRSLPLPKRKTTATDQTIVNSKSPVEEAIRQIALSDVMTVNDRIAKLRARARDVFSPNSSSNQCEEAVRAIGAGLGFISTRPDTDCGKGPDNLWVDAHSNTIIALELKTDKSDEGSLTKEDIGQGHNHLEWIKSQYPGLKLIGLIYLTKARKISGKSDPSVDMHLASPDSLQKVWNDFFDAVDRVKMLSPLEKIAEASKIGGLAEWEPSGIFRRLATDRCKK